MSHPPDAWPEMPPRDIQVLTRAILAVVRRAVIADLDSLELASAIKVRFGFHGEMAKVMEAVASLVGGYDAHRTEQIRYLREELVRLRDFTVEPILIERADKPARPV